MNYLILLTKLRVTTAVTVLHKFDNKNLDEINKHYKNVNLNRVLIVALCENMMLTLLLKRFSPLTASGAAF